MCCKRVQIGCVHVYSMSTQEYVATHMHDNVHFYFLRLYVPYIPRSAKTKPESTCYFYVTFYSAPTYFNRRKQSPKTVPGYDTAMATRQQRNERGRQQCSSALRSTDKSPASTLPTDRRGLNSNITTTVAALSGALCFIGTAARASLP